MLAATERYEGPALRQPRRPRHLPPRPANRRRRSRTIAC